MPIRAEMKDRYPKDWPEISRRVRDAAQHKCEHCGVRNHAWGYRDLEGRFHECARDGFGRDYGRPPFYFGAHRIIEIVLTVAHLNHHPEDCDRSNLRALCQKCHLRYDAPMKQAGMRERARAALNV